MATQVNHHIQDTKQRPPPARKEGEKESALLWSEMVAGVVQAGLCFGFPTNFIHFHPHGGPDAQTLVKGWP